MSSVSRPSTDNADASPVYIVMGVSGAGKSTVGSLLARELKIPFYDADDFHTPESLEKLRQGQGLSDADREPWLKSLAQHIAHCAREEGAVLACSALRQSYRQRFRQAATSVRFIFLTGRSDVISRRLQQRSDGGEHVITKHDAIMQGQYRTLEAPSDALTVDIESSPREIVADIVAAIDSGQLS